ncbi:MAG: hypothetical protein HOV96_09965 [Nonomuraea sp.]|nr:hypothetical protein [Nonomuraea sp.]
MSVGDVTISGDVVSATVTVRTGGTAAVTATGTWTAPGTGGHTRRLRLSGATSYERTFTWALGERPCGRTVTLTVTTSPAAPGGARSGSVAVPACPVRVTGLDVSLAMPAAPGMTARAQVRVTASGTGQIPVEVAFAVNGDAVGTRTASLSGRTSYSRAFTHAFRSRPCGATLSVRVRAGDRAETARAEVTCPPGVKQVSIVRAALGENGIVATVSVTTVNDRPVTLDVAFALGEAAGSERVTLSGDTAYTRTVSRSFRSVPCGSSWSVTASTDPGAGNGSDSAGGKTPECPRETPKPEETPKPQETPKSDTPGTIN